MECCDVINRQPMGSVAANSNNFRGDTFIHDAPVVKSHQGGNEVSRALGVRFLAWMWKD